MTTARAMFAAGSRLSLLRLGAGFALIYLVLDRAATWTHSLYGEYGALICTLVVVAALGVERWLHATRWRAALRALGFGRPAGRGLLAALLACLALLAAALCYVLISGQALRLRAGWGAIALGVFLQGGIAEELLWRGYLFRHLRATRGFWRAAGLAMLVMVAQHGLLLWTLPLPIALASLVVAIATSFPLAYLFELGGNTLWGAALLHAVIQGALKVVLLPEAIALPAQLGWMAASVLLPYLVFAVRQPAPRPQVL
jgi:membrane protease YdiL (CAAX protease family)